MIYKIIIIIFLIMIAVVYSGNNKSENLNIEIDSQAPLFTSIDHNKNEIKLKDYIEHYVVIYFFPKAFTPGWTKQACGFRDKYSIYIDNNVTVLGISYDSPKKLKKFKEKHNLPFTLISDKDKYISKQYNSGGMLFPSRKTIIIRPGGTVVDIINNVNIDSHSNDIIKIILDDKLLKDKN